MLSENYFKIIFLFLVVFHVATLMPLKDCDKKCISKKRHIGNNYVTIIYDDSEKGYSFGTIKVKYSIRFDLIITPYYISSFKSNCS